MDGYCKRYLFFLTGNADFTMCLPRTSLQTMNQTWKHKRNLVIGQCRMVNGYSNYVLLSGGLSENDVYVDKRQISHNIYKLIDEHTDFEKIFR